MKTTIILPVSRPDYLQEIFSSLEFLECANQSTNILAIVDGDINLFTKTRNLVQNSKFTEKLCVQFTSKHKLRHYDVLARRLRIADIHNQIKQYIRDVEYIFGLEDDTIIPVTALKKLQSYFLTYPYAGVIQGITLGRHGIAHLGAWKVNDIYQPTTIESLVATKQSHGLKEVDGTGLYCFLTKAEVYMAHTFMPFDGNSLGPDINYSFDLRRQGFKNYTDLDLRCVHKSKQKDLSLNTVFPSKVTFTKQPNGQWRQKVENIVS